MARVEGFEPANSGQTPTGPCGVWGDSDSGAGVLGTSGVLPSGVQNAPTGNAGVEGHGVDTLGVFGRSQFGTGVLGVTFQQDVGSSSGVFGSSTAGGNGVTGFVGSATGVRGSSVRGGGVRGSGATFGVQGESFGGSTSIGVEGRGSNGVGVRGKSQSNSGVVGVTTGSGYGTFGLHFSQDPGSGVFGESVLGDGVEGHSYTGFGVSGEGRGGGVRGGSTSRDPAAGGIVGENPSGFAGVFLGRVRVTGFLAKAGGGFEIDHPTDPTNKYLRHSFVESPDMLNVYSGTVSTDENGEAAVRLPDYFDALNQDVRYQLTVIGDFAQAIVAREVTDNEFTIKTDQPKVKVCWQVTGTRKDPWAAANRLVVEDDKPAEEKGRYLHPGPWGQPEQTPTDREPHRTNHRRQVTQLMPEQLKDRVEPALREAERLDRNGLRRLVAEMLEQVHPQGADERERVVGGRVEEELRRFHEDAGLSTPRESGA